MMKEVSMAMAYDAHNFDQMSEEELLASLMDETGLDNTVPTKKAKLRKCRLELMVDKDEPLDRYLKENRQLQQTSLRLEQENDNLAHRLISSKVALRNALDKAEDRVDELTKDLLLTRHRLQATEEVKRLQEEEAAMLKEVFRRELEKAEQEVKRSSGIIADYKQICSQLTNRLEKQQAAHREELDSLKSVMRGCSRCQHIVESDDPSDAGQSSESAGQTEGRGMAEQGREENDAGSRREDREKESLGAQIRELEQELVQTKVQMVEAQCMIQELEHQKGILSNDLQDAKKSWISKAFTSLRTSSEGLHAYASGLTIGGPPAQGWSLDIGDEHWYALQLWPA